MTTSSRRAELDGALGWWLRGTDDRLPYRANKAGIFFCNPGEVIGLDLRKVANPRDMRLTRPAAFIVDGKSAAEFLPRTLETRCPNCTSTAISLHHVEASDDQVGCRGCGGMFDLSTYTDLCGYPVALDWAVRLEGRWSAGDETLVAQLRPAMVSAKGAQAARAALAVARSCPLRSFAPGEIDDKGLASLGAQPQLKELHLWFTKVTGKGMASLEGSSSLEHLNAGNNRSLGDEGAEYIARVTSLKTLNLEQTAIGDAGLAQLARLSSLEVLVLNATKISDEGLSALRNHPALRRIAVGWTKISDAALRHLATIPTLETVDAWDCQFESFKNGLLSRADFAP